MTGRLLAVLLAITLTCPLNAQPAPSKVNITFKVKVPASTPKETKIHIAGDNTALGEWNAAGPELKKGDDGVWSIVVTLPRDRPIEYKFTRGSWETVEKNADGSEMNNRTFTPTRDATVDIEVGSWADQAAAQPAQPSPKGVSRTGDIRVHEKFSSKNLNNDRSILVYLPPDYATNGHARYPVFYMHDGQHLFNPVGWPDEWQVDEAAERLIKEKKIEPVIIVAIANTPGRIDEYTLTRDDERKMGGKGGAYIRFVAEELKPFIDLTYRTKSDRANTGTGGSSLGATIALEMCRARPDLFSRCAVISPALWWAKGDILKRLSTDNAWAKKCRIWIDVGTAEVPAEQSKELIGMARALASIFASAGLSEGKDYKLEVVEGAKHEIPAWAARMDRVLLFLFPPI